MELLDQLSHKPIMTAQGLHLDTRTKRGMVLGLGLLLSLTTFSVAAPPANPTDCIILITTDMGRGTGFLCNMDGSNYIVTCTHVLAGAQRFEFSTINKGQVKPVKLELANDRDLARLHIADASVPAFELSGTDPKIGNRVKVLGNSQGSGTITELTGEIKGIGPELLEVDAGFVSGNSGSPILDDEARVMAIASFVAKPGVTNWITSGTRFADTRRFGVRPNNVKWVTVSTRRFYQEASVLADFDTFLYDASLVARLLDHHNLEDLPKVVALQKQGSRPRYADTGYATLINGVCNSFSLALDAYKRGLDIRSSSVSAPLQNAEMSFGKFPELPLRKIHDAKWSTKHYEDMAKDYEKIFTTWKQPAK